MKRRRLNSPLPISPAYAGSHGCKAVEECIRVSSEALAKEDMLRRIPPKIPKGPRLPVLRSRLLQRMDKAVGLHLATMICSI